MCDASETKFQLLTRARYVENKLNALCVFEVHPRSY
jgi:hypothetical protein